MTSPASAEALTDRILAATVTDPATVIKAPPGAGKSYLAALIAGLNTLGMGRRVAIATPTREQGKDLARNIAAAYPDALTVWHAPTPTEGLPHAKTPADLPATAHVAVGTLAKWSYYDPDKHDGPGYDLLIVDEAWQVTDAAFATVAHVADRYALIGDPGQIAPVVTADMSEWSADPDAPTLPSPQVLTYRRPDTSVFALPDTRRFGPGSAATLSEAFYDFDWGSIAPTYRLTGGPLEQISDGAEITSSTLPAAEGLTRDDPALAAHIAALAAAYQDQATLTVDGRQIPVGTIYVPCAHIDQVAAARAATAGLDVVVDTAERLQGRQANIVIAWHPASGLEAVAEFQRDTGRLCVSMSRHKAACVVVMREDTADRLAAYESTGRSVTGPDETYRAWATSHAVTTRLLNGNG